MNFETFLQEFNRAKELCQKFVVVTFVNAQGSVPQEVGARLIVSEEGYFSGTVGGGKVEKAAIEKSLEYLKTNGGGSFFYQWNLQTDLGMSCGGVVSLFFEVHQRQSNWELVVFGAGHVAQELIRVLLRLECRITCIDSRLEWLDKLPTDPRLQKICLQPMEDFVSKLKGNEFIMVVTMGHATDLPILEKILKTKVTPPYLGVIGSDVKAQKLRKILLDTGTPADLVNSFFCPMGESIGNNTPAEIAISIAGQLLRVRDELLRRKRNLESAFGTTNSLT